MKEERKSHGTCVEVLLSDSGVQGVESFEGSISIRRNVFFARGESRRWWSGFVSKGQTLEKILIHESSRTFLRSDAADVDLSWFCVIRGCRDSCVDSLFDAQNPENRRIAERARPRKALCRPARSRCLPNRRAKRPRAA